MTTMQPLPRKGKRLRIFLGEAQEWQGKPLYRAILELVQQHGAAGATVLRGIEGYISSHDYKRADDQTLAALAKRIRE